MPSGPLNRPLSRLFRPASPLSPSLTERVGTLDGASPEQLAAIAMADSEAAVRAAAIERLPDGPPLRDLAGLHHNSSPSPEFAPLAQQRLASLVDAHSVDWNNLCSDATNTSAILQVAELCADPVYLEQAVAAIEDPQRLIRLVLEGSSVRLRQVAAHRIEDREDLNRLLKQLQGKDKSVYRILKEKRDGLRAEAQQAAHVEQDIRTIYTSLEALLSRPYDALFAPAVEHFGARWQSFEGQAQPWARERVRVAIERCREIMAAHLKEVEQHAARLAEHAAQEAAAQSAREEARAQAAEIARDRHEAAALAAAETEARRQAEEKARLDREAAEALPCGKLRALMARAHGALRAGHTGPAAGLRRAIEGKLPVSARSAAPARARSARTRCQTQCAQGMEGLRRLAQARGIDRRHGGTRPAPRSPPSNSPSASRICGRNGRPSAKVYWWIRKPIGNGSTRRL